MWPPDGNHSARRPEHKRTRLVLWVFSIFSSSVRTLIFFYQGDGGCSGIGVGPGVPTREALWPRSRSRGAGGCGRGGAFGDGFPVTVVLGYRHC